MVGYLPMSLERGYCFINLETRAVEPLMYRGKRLVCQSFAFTSVAKHRVVVRGGPSFAEATYYMVDISSRSCKKIFGLCYGLSARGMWVENEEQTALGLAVYHGNNFDLKWMINFTPSSTNIAV